MKNLQAWEFKKRVKITLKDGNILYCDTEEYGDIDEHGDITCFRNKDTKYWGLEAKTVGWVVDWHDIESIEHY